MKESQDKKKYTHFIKRKFVDFFLNKINEKIDVLDAQKIVDIGCGEGYPESFFLERKPNLKITGIDTNDQHLKEAKKKNPKAEYIKGDIYNLNFNKDFFDLAIVLEVLEHLKEPNVAVGQVKKISKKAIFSVPYEPWFSLLSFLGGSYIKSLGRHPEHVNFWNIESFKKMLLKDYGKVNIELAFPWIIAVCEK
ncbi:class I SAM-dependent methyltransferase [Candidatus Microgenomates bacterium]|jgi:2-polyprenyl-3-methyl-5-hydroxy-6-metoxy-1,4-benzoquinol methylase|nr:MAG: class I SAM-dependent methyltransferase [Candidatus Microgenomates bacterium]